MSLHFLVRFETLPGNNLNFEKSCCGFSTPPWLKRIVWLSMYSSRSMNRLYSRFIPSGGTKLRLSSTSSRG